MLVRSIGGGAAKAQAVRPLVRSAPSLILNIALDVRFQVFWYACYHANLMRRSHTISQQSRSGTSAWQTDTNQLLEGKVGDSVSSRPEDGEPLRIWEVERLWELAQSLPVKRVPLTELTDLDRVGWYGQSHNAGHLTLREVAEHTRRIEAADLDYPIILSAEGHLLDGFHRLAKAYLLGLPDIAAVQFVSNPEPDRVRPLPDWLRQALTLRM